MKYVLFVRPRYAPAGLLVDHPHARVEADLMFAEAAGWNRPRPAHALGAARAGRRDDVRADGLGQLHGIAANCRAGAVDQQALLGPKTSAAFSSASPNLARAL